MGEAGQSPALSRNGRSRFTSVRARSTTFVSVTAFEERYGHRLISPASTPGAGFFCPFPEMSRRPCEHLHLLDGSL